MTHELEVKIAICVDQIHTQLKRKGRSRTAVRLFEAENQAEVVLYLKEKLKERGIHCSVDEIGIVTAWYN
jgi:hypothetical protein